MNEVNILLKEGYMESNIVITQHINKALAAVLLGALSLLTACSSAYNQRSQVRNLPVLPEVTRPVRRAPLKTVIVRKQKISSAKVHKYSVNKPKASDAVITQKEIAAVITNTEDDRGNIDPFAAIPDDSRSKVISNRGTLKPVVEATESSPAVKSLIIRAQADLAVGRINSAVSHLERGLRIESTNPKLWSLLAQAHYDETSYQQSISMAKKAIRYANDDSLIAKNWALIKKAGLQSNDTMVVKEANNYIKLNP